MTTTNESARPKDRSILFNRILYGTFIALAIYSLATQRIAEAMSNLGIALIFDPFDQKVTWKDRPLYQRTWLIVHLSILLGFIGIMVIQYFSVA
ncbi:hypothetical protein BH09BAC3_BH09BAC3_13890 [soil metagenome]